VLKVRASQGGFGRATAGSGDRISLSLMTGVF